MPIVYELPIKNTDKVHYILQMHSASKYIIYRQFICVFHWQLTLQIIYDGN